MTLQLGGDGAITGCTSLENPDLTVSGLTISGSFDAEKVLVASGTAAAPSYTFSGDTDNGLYYAGTNSIGLATAGTNAILIDSSGRVGIGTSNPSDTLHLDGSTGYGLKITDASSHIGVYRTHSDGAILKTASNHDLLFGTNDTERMRITSAGGVGIGTSNPTNTLHVNGSTYVHNNLTVGAYDTSPYLRGIRLFPDNGGRSTLVLNGDGTSNTAIGIYDGNASSYKTKLQHDGGGYFLGNIMIGTTSAATNANVTVRATSPQLSLYATPANVSRITLGDTDDHDIGQIGYDNSDNSMFFGTNNTTRMSIDSSGFIHQKFTSNNSSTPEGLFINNQNNATGNNASLIFSNDSGNRKKVAIAAVDVGNYGASDLVFALDGTDSGSVSLSSDEKMRIDSSGNVGIGETSPGQLLHLSSSGFPTIRVTDADNSTYFDITNSDGDIILKADEGNAFASSAIRFNVDASERMRITSSGHLLIGTSTSTSLSDRLLQIGDTSRSATYAELRTSTSGTAGIVFSDGTSGNTGYRGNIEFDHGDENMLFYTAAEPRMRIDNTGMLRVRGTSTDGALNVFTGQSASNSINLILGQHSSTSVTSGTLSFLVLSNGDVKNSNNTYGSLSDISLKENIVDANSQWDDIKSLRVRNYNFKEETGHETFTQIGVIAQEIETVSPGLVSSQPNKDEEGNDLDTVTKAVKYSVLYMKAVKALQEAMERIETLEAEVAVLKNN